MPSQSHLASSKAPRWIRGVNLGGWLVLERYITPYQFSLTDCHVQATEPSDLCWYEGALSAPPTHSLAYRECDLTRCQPFLQENIFNHTDYPIDEWHLAAAFVDRDVATTWFNTHFANFVTQQDFARIQKAGLTHVRIPLPHWILGDVQDGEPWIVGHRWQALQRAVDWARALGLQVWPNLHTAPGSQNGFDNSGIESVQYTCDGWWKQPENVQRTLRVIQQITAQMKKDDMLDVVTGFGLLNEPFGDCDMEVYTTFLDDALAIARHNLGDDAKIYVADRFASSKFNNGTWWLDEPNTLLDSHIYHVFADVVRAYSPVQHLQRVCHPEEPENTIADCCWQDGPQGNTVPSQGVRRISTEWSAAFDAMPGELLQVVMRGIAENGTAPDFYRTLDADRGDFTRKFAQAQMVVLEDEQVSDGWFYWTWKTEGGAYAEWDFSQGLEEGWMPTIVDPNMSSASVYGSCDEILANTVNDTSVIHPFPWGDEPYWTTDDNIAAKEEKDDDGDDWNNLTGTNIIGWIAFVAMVVGGYYLWQHRRRRLSKERQYEFVGQADETTPLKV